MARRRPGVSRGCPGGGKVSPCADLCIPWHRCGLQLGTACGWWRAGPMQRAAAATWIPGPPPHVDTSRMIDAWIVAGLGLDTHHTPTIILHQPFKHWQVCTLRRDRQSDRDIILFETCSNLIWKSILVRDFHPAMMRSHKYHNSYNVRIEPLPLNNWEAKTFKIHNIKAKHDSQLVLSHI